MGIRRNRAAADRLVGEALAERRARQAHTARALAILRERVASPGGLAVCFGAGLLTGFRKARRVDEAEREGGGLLHGLLHGPVGSIAARLAAATIIRGLMQPAAAPESGMAAEPAVAGDGGPADF